MGRCGDAARREENLKTRKVEKQQLPKRANELQTAN